ncbi:MAG: DUF1615 family protein [Myxococcales bacterium]
MTAAMGGCRGGQQSVAPASAGLAPPPLRADEIAALIPQRVRDRGGWADAILNALAANNLNADKQPVCAVIAVIAQESGFAEDPVVPGLAKLVATRVDRYKDRLGPLGEPLLKRLLAGRAPDNARSFEDRLATVRTERDVDLLFRDLLAYYEVNHPALFAAVNFAGRLVDLESLAELNPITTAGSMQVSVRFAEDWARAHKGTTATAASVRESLYTRAGGVYYGTARLLVYPARYDQAIFRFADYNAGFYTSRNASVQSQVAQLTGHKLALDGDLLAYEKNGAVKGEETESQRAFQVFAQRRFVPDLDLDLSRPQIRSDLLTEKTIEFENTRTYAAVKHVAEQRWGAPVPYAILPEVTISSPKFTRTRSTAWFAQSVDRRYQACLSGPSR